MTSLTEEFAANREHLARTRALSEEMEKEIARREAMGVDVRELRETQAEAMGVRFFAVPASPQAERRPWPKDDFSRPVGTSRRVYAVGFRGRVSQFLGYEDDPDTVERMLSLADHWQIQYEDVFEDSISDEWLGRAVAEPGSHEKIVEEREAWDDYEFAKMHREEIAADRFEYRGNDARSSFADATERQRRQRNDQQLQLELERGAEVLGNEKHRAALRDRKRFRAYVEAFGQDPDAPEIKAWVAEIIGHYVYADGRTLPERRGYKRCIALLVAKAEREGVTLPTAA